MLSLLHMFPLESPWCQVAGDENKLLTYLPSSPKLTDSVSTVVIGPFDNAIGKTCLLFQSAVSHATKGASVTFICHEPLSRMPIGVHGMPKPDANVLKSVNFLYMSNVEEVIQYCSTLHMKLNHPDLLIVDDLSLYIDQLKDTSTEHGAARLCALLVDSVAYVNSKRDSMKCQLLVACSDKTNHLHTVFNKFKFSILSLLNEDGDLHQLTLNQSSLHVSLSYQVENGGIFLKNVRMDHKDSEKGEISIGKILTESVQKC